MPASTASEFFRSSILAGGGEPPQVDASQPHIARVCDYWLGGKDNFAADRKVGDLVLEIHPQTAVFPGRGRPVRLRDSAGRTR